MDRAEHSPESHAPRFPHRDVPVRRPGNENERRSWARRARDRGEPDLPIAWLGFPDRRDGFDRRIFDRHRAREAAAAGIVVLERTGVGCDEPATIGDLLGALAGLERCAGSAAAALHLALPVDAVGGIDAWRDETGWHWRDAFVPAGGQPLEEIVELVAAGRRDGDRFVDLYDEPLGWLKILRSGTRQIVFGAELLFGLPAMVADVDIDDALVIEVCRQALGERGVSAPAVVSDPDGNAVLVDGTANAWTLRDLRTAPASIRQDIDDIERLAAEIAEGLGVANVESVELGRRVAGSVDVEYLAEVEGWEVIVPATLGENAERVGLPAADIAPSPPVPLPVGFRHLGRSRFEEAEAGEHEASGVRALLRKSGHGAH